MGATTIGAIRTGSRAVRALAVEELGQAIVRYGVALVIVWIGPMKFTAYEAAGIQPLVSHGPFMGATASVARPDAGFT